MKKQEKKMRRETEIDPKQYPTLAKYSEAMIWDAVLKLMTKYPDMTREQCLLNLEMDLAQQEQMALG